MRTFILALVLVTVSAKNTANDVIEDIVETAQKVQKIDETMESSLKKQEKSFEQDAKKHPLRLFKELRQRACPWSAYKRGTDWKFASTKTDDKEQCARACVAEKGCTGFEVGPQTSEKYNSISYCSLWFNKKCNDEKIMLHLAPSGYVASTYVMLKSVTVDVKNKENTPFGTFEVEETKTFQPDESKDHYNSVHKKETTGIQKSTLPKVQPEKMSASTTDAVSSVSNFEEFSQLACVFSQYNQGSDYNYAKTTGDVEVCAAACLRSDDCSGFEIGIDNTHGEYCALWESGACSTKTAMIPIPVSEQTVSTFVLADYHSKHVDVDGFAIVFLVACACAMVISVLLVGCICYRVCRRVCCRRVEVDTNTDQSVVAGELVQAKVVRGTPVGQHVDVVVVRGEAVDQN